MSNKIGFWSVLALVVGSQIGSGVFMLPASLASFGSYSLAGWVIAGFGAIALALVFANLCAKFPKTGGPHVYVEQLFGKDLSFFVGWTYWVVSWISTSAVVIAAISYLSPFIGDQSPMVYLSLELLLLLIMCCLNLFGVSTAGRAETVFTGLKFIPLLIVPVVAIYGFNSDNFYVSEAIASQDTSTTLGQVTLLTLWGFIGVESATTPAGSVENPEKTIPRAIVLGTILVALIYIFNSVAIMMKTLKPLLPSAFRQMNGRGGRTIKERTSKGIIFGKAITFLINVSNSNEMEIDETLDFNLEDYTTDFYIPNKVYLSLIEIINNYNILNKNNIII